MIKVVDLVLFSVNNIFFGVLAKQVEELLDADGLHEPGESNVEDTIIYKGQNIRVVDFAKWLAQSQGMGNGNRATKIRTSLNPESQTATRSLEFEEQDEYIYAPKILIIKHHHERYIGVYVDNLEDLVSVPVEQMHSLPIIMQKTRRIQGLWGITIVQDRSMLLIDLEQL